MVEGVSPPPEIVWRQCQHADDASNPIIREAVAEERSVAAIVLDHKETYEKARSRQSKQKAAPIAGLESSPRQKPQKSERPCRDHELEDAPHVVRLAILNQRLGQGSGVG
jgi:hypothetical protein